MMKKFFQVSFAVALLFVAVAATPVFSQPVIDVTPDSLAFALNEGDSAVAQIIIRNTGSTTLNFELTNEFVSSAALSANYPETFHVLNSEKALNPYADLENVISQSASKFVTNSSLSTTQSSSSESSRMFGAAGNQIVEIDLNTGNLLNSFSTPVTTSDGPTGLAFSGSKLYFTDAFTTPDIFVLDPATGAVLNSYPAPTSAIDALAIIGNKLYAQDYGSGYIYELDAETGTQLRTIYPAVPVAGGIDGINGRLFASNFNSMIYELNLTDGSVINSFAPVNTVYGLGLSSNYLYASVPGGGIDKYDINTGDYIGSISSLSFAALAGGGDYWLTEFPTDGSVLPGDSVSIEIKVSTSMLNAGDYNAMVLINNNDTFRPQDTVAIYLKVIGIPNIVLAVDSLDFGDNYIGFPSSRLLRIANDGTDVLEVFDITSDNSHFSVISPTAFNIAKGEFLDIEIQFIPSVFGLETGILNINSSDSTEPNVTVQLSGSGIFPPDIYVSPDSLDDSLFTGETAIDTLTIGNSNGIDLIFDISIIPVDSGATSSTLFSLPMLTLPTNTLIIDAPAGTNSIEEGATVPALSAPLADLSGKKIGLLLSSSLYSSIVADLVSRGAEVEYLGYPFTISHLNSFDILAIDDFIASLTTSDITLIRTWLQNGKGLLVQADNSSSVTNINSLLFGTGISESYLGGFYDANLNSFLPHFTTDGVSSINALGYGTSCNVLAPAQTVVFDNASRPHAAVSQLGTGRVFAIGNEFSADFNITGFDTRLFANQVFGWLASVSNAINIEPKFGTIPAGSSLDLTVTFDAANLNGGNYYADVVISSNDPDESELIVPAHLHVTGAPDIAVSPDSINFAPLFIGLSNVDTVLVENRGTDLLDVSSVVSSHSDFLPEAISFTLNPGESFLIPVSFTPTTADSINALLTLTSNDPDQPSVLVSLSGVGLTPPDISVSPDSLRDSLFTGDVSFDTLTIHNFGGNDLIVNLNLNFTSSTPVMAFLEDALFNRLMDNYDANQDLFDSETNNQTPQSKLDASSLSAAASAGIYTGDFLSFGISDYGEIMPFQFPVGNEHLQVGRYLSGYTVAYQVSGNDRIAWAAFDGGRSQFVPVSYTEITNNTSEVIVEVVTRTSDNLLRITRTFKFDRSDQYIHITSSIENISGGLVTDVVFKSYADWDTDAEFYTTWDYDLSRNMVYTSLTNFTAIASKDVPHLMDIDGWGDYDRRTTGVDYPTGPVLSKDGLAIIHLELGDINAGTLAETEIVYGAGSSLADLEDVIDRGFMSSNWLSLVPHNATIPAGMSYDFEITFDATGLYDGDYLADVIISSNDPDESEIIVPAFLHVTGAPDIAISPDSIEFGSLFIGYSIVDTILVENVGTDILNVTSVASDNSNFLVTTSNFTLNPRENIEIPVTFNPNISGALNGLITFTSDDPIQPVVSVHLSGQGLIPPDISVSPDSLDEILAIGDSSIQALTIFNNGGSDLYWELSSSFSEITTSIFSSPIFTPTGDLLQTKDTTTEVTLDKSPSSEVYTFDNNGNDFTPQPSATANAIELEHILDKLNAGFETVTNSIPNKYNFYEGTAGYYISDGGGDMYDGGNQLSTNFGGALNYSDNLIANSSLFGTAGRYFTIKYPGLFVMAADIQNVNYFQITGNLGADGRGNADGSILETTYNGITYLGFVKRVFNAGDPSVNHLMIIEYDSVATHEFATYTDDDYHRILNLNGVNRIYYLLYAGNSGYYIDDTTTLDIMTNFLTTLDLYPQWVISTPSSGTVLAGQTQNVDVHFNATGLEAGDYFADLHFNSNDPDEPELIVPAHLNVYGVPNIALSSDSIVYGSVFTGGYKDGFVLVQNIGTDVLDVTSITSDHSDFTTLDNSFSLNPGEVQIVTVTFNPSSLGVIDGVLTIASNDPDTPLITALLHGEGIAPPEIEVSPTSLAKSLILSINPIETDTLKIYNKAGSDLIWNISLRFDDLEPLNNYTLTAPPSFNSTTIAEPLVGTPSLPLPSSRTYSLQSYLSDLTGVVIMFDESHGTSGSGYWQTMFSDLQTRGATVIINSSSITSTLLADVDIFWLTDHSPNWTPLELIALTDWVIAGGGLLLEGDQSSSSYNIILGNLGVSTTYLASNGHQGLTTNITPHETTVGVDSLYILNPIASLTPPTLPSTTVLVFDGLGVPNTAYSYVGNGVVVAMADELLYDGVIVAGDNQIFGNQIFSFLSSNGKNWLSVTPQNDVNSVGDTTFAEVVFNGTNLRTGLYTATILINSNDPIVPILEVPVELDILEFICGDANADGLIDQNDLAYARQTYFDCGPLPSPIRAIDFNCNNRIDITDIMTLGRYLNGIGTLDCCYNSLLSVPSIGAFNINGKMK